MKSKNQQSENSIETGKSENLDDELQTPALLAPRYLLPAITENEAGRKLSANKVMAVISVAVVLVGLIALYIHGGNVAVTTL